MPPEAYTNVVLSSNPCPDCKRANGVTMTMAEWKKSEYGIPGSDKRICDGNCHCVLVPEELMDEFPEIDKRTKLRGDIDTDIGKTVDIYPNETRLQELMDQYNATIGKLPPEIYDMPLEKIADYLDDLLKKKALLPGKVGLKEAKYLREAKSNIMTKYKADGFEHGMAFDKNGKLLISKSGAVDHIKYSSQELYRNYEAEIHIHNHPGVASFSSADLEFYSAMKIKKGIVVGDRHTYQLSPIGKKWPSEVGLSNAWNQQLKNTKLIREYGGDPGLWGEFTHEIMLRVAKKYKLNYTRTLTGGY